MLIDGCNEKKKKEFRRRRRLAEQQSPCGPRPSYLSLIYSPSKAIQDTNPLNGQYHLSTWAHITIFKRRFSGR